MSNSIKRILKDVKKFYEEKHEDIFIHTDEKDTREIYALIIGPKDSVYAGGFFYFHIKMFNYPIYPPKVKFLTPYNPSFRLHPNLYACGKCCLSILNTWGTNEWSALLNINTILVTIQSLLDENPLSHEPGYYNVKKDTKEAKNYAIMARYLTMLGVKHMRTREDLPDEFKEIINDYVEKNKELYEKNFEILDEYENQNIKAFHGAYTIRNYRF